MVKWDKSRRTQVPVFTKLEDFEILAIHDIDPDARFNIQNGVMHWEESNANDIR